MNLENSSIYKLLYGFFLELGTFVQFTINTFKSFFRPPYENTELIRHAYIVGNKSLSLIGITAFIMGLVLTMQTRPVLADFGAESLLPGMIALSILREIGPVITALLAAGKISSGFAAEIASMKITEQIDAMEVSGTNPMKYIVASRVIASTMMLPLLVIFADVVGIFGSFVAINFNSSINFALFAEQVRSVLGFEDLIPPLIKSFVFGFFIGIIGCYKGYYANRGTKSVGTAANSAVVAASVSIFIIDLFAVQIMEIIN
jgi:phospholipid/cholesterol/gamma-HCH transport system permease protein